ncbi:MAG: hypothetical protein Ct9H300mP21_08900 [Pseudomonadota bacterium]|nr:MAG: hypothetical protein Ct9H300mP21_08900 [Pseudomonadota bacterium]
MVRHESLGRTLCMQDFGGGAWLEELFLGSACPLPVDVLQVRYGGREGHFKTLGCFDCICIVRSYFREWLVESGWIMKLGEPFFIPI